MSTPHEQDSVYMGSGGKVLHRFYGRNSTRGQDMSVATLVNNSTCMNNSVSIECAAGKYCAAPSNTNIADSTHDCWGCKNKIHSVLLCGYFLSDLLNKDPFLVGTKTFANSKRIEQDANNETRSVCYTCINHLSIFPRERKLGKSWQNCLQRKTCMRQQ
jgi:hypothetical protein